MIDITVLIIIIGLFMVGMWGAFFLGSRKEAERIFESEKNLEPESMDIPEEVTEDEYQKSLKDWSISGEAIDEDANSETG